MTAPTAIGTDNSDAEQEEMSKKGTSSCMKQKSVTAHLNLLPVRQRSLCRVAWEMGERDYGLEQMKARRAGAVSAANGASGGAQTAEALAPRKALRAEQRAASQSHRWPEFSPWRCQLQMRWLAACLRHHPEICCPNWRDSKRKPEQTQQKKRKTWRKRATAAAQGQPEREKKRGEAKIRALPPREEEESRFAHFHSIFERSKEGGKDSGEMFDSSQAEQRHEQGNALQCTRALQDRGRSRQRSARQKGSQRGKQCHETVQRLVGMVLFQLALFVREHARVSRSQQRRVADEATSDSSNAQQHKAHVRENLLIGCLALGHGKKKEKLDGFSSAAKKN